MLSKGFCPLIFRRQSLDCGSFGPQCGREVTWLGFGDDRGRHCVWTMTVSNDIPVSYISRLSKGQPTLVSSSADITQQNRIRIARRLPQEIPAIGTENQGPNGRHAESVVPNTAKHPRNIEPLTEQSAHIAEIFCCWKGLLGPLTALR